MHIPTHQCQHALHDPTCPTCMYCSAYLMYVLYLARTAQKKKGAKKGKIEVKKEMMSKLNDDEKNDLVSLEIELVQAEVEQLKKAGDKDIDDIKTLMEEVGRDSRRMPPTSR